MALGLRHPRQGTIRGMGQSTQLNTQADIVTAVAYTASGAIAEADNVITLSKSGILAATIAAPTPGRLLIISQLDSGTDGHTVTLTSGTWDLTGNTIATFNNQYEELVVLGISDKRFLILKNTGAVALS